jgi:hypothetical protein
MVPDTLTVVPVDAAVVAAPPDAPEAVVAAPPDAVVAVVVLELLLLELSLPQAAATRARASAPPIAATLRFRMFTRGSPSVVKPRAD